MHHCFQETPRNLAYLASMKFLTYSVKFCINICCEAFKYFFVCLEYYTHISIISFVILVQSIVSFITDGAPPLCCSEIFGQIRETSGASCRCRDHQASAFEQPLLELQTATTAARAVFFQQQSRQALQKS